MKPYVKNILKTYKRLEMPPYNSLYYLDNFILESLAKPQWRKLKLENSFNLTPFTYFKKTNKEYKYWEELSSIKYCASFFMKEFNIIAYGNDHMNKDLDTLMVRGWLHEDKKNKLNILVMMEKLNYSNIRDDYYFILNNPYWYPSLKFFKRKDGKSYDEIKQEIDYNNKKYIIY